MLFLILVSSRYSFQVDKEHIDWSKIAVASRAAVVAFGERNSLTLVVNKAKRYFGLQSKDLQPPMLTVEICRKRALNTPVGTSSTRPPTKIDG
jgi:hypothetical protein